MSKNESKNNNLSQKLISSSDNSETSFKSVDQPQNQLGISLQSIGKDSSSNSSLQKKNQNNQIEIEEQKINVFQNGSSEILESPSKADQKNQKNMNTSNLKSNNNLQQPISFYFYETPQTDTVNNNDKEINFNGIGNGSKVNQNQKDPSFMELNEVKLQNSRVSYQDLDELHEDLLDERENDNQENFEGCCFCIFKKKKQQTENWLKHFKLLVKNTRFIENSWSGGLFDLINKRFQGYKNADSEQQELHQNAQNTLDDSKLKKESSNRAFSSERTTLDNRPSSKLSQQNSNSKDMTKTQSQEDMQITKDIKKAIQNSVILEEDIESLRESLKTDQILSQLENLQDSQEQSSGSKSQANQKNSGNNKDQEDFKSSFNNKIDIISKDGIEQKSATNSKIISIQREDRINSKMEIIGRSIDIVTQQISSDQKSKLKIDSKYKNRIRSNSLKRKMMQTQSMSRNGSEITMRGMSQQGINDSRFDDSIQIDQVGDDALGTVSNVIKTNTLLINSEVLQEKDFELYQAVVYYKSITFVIEQHLVEENNFTQEKPLRVIRDNFIEYYISQYGKNLQKLEENEIVKSIQDLKEFVTLYLEVIREYYNLDDLVDKCKYADRFITTDNLINFLCSILFQNDAVYSIIYVSHCHFEPKLSNQYFKNAKQLHKHIQLSVLKVKDDYCLNEKTLLKLQTKMRKQNCSINDTNTLKGYTFVPPYQRAFEHLKTISYQRSPVHKLKVIIKTQDLINECIKDFYDYFGIDQSEMYYDADNLVGIFSYILIKSEIYDIIAHCKIIENFATKNTLNSHSGYLLITLQCCIRFISSIDVNLLLQENRLELIQN
ncbi:hypothetical protein ABPG72_010646 [Tetrahymena utriculariae]